MICRIILPDFEKKEILLVHRVYVERAQIKRPPILFKSQNNVVEWERGDCLGQYTIVNSFVQLLKPQLLNDSEE